MTHKIRFLLLAGLFFLGATPTFGAGKSLSSDQAQQKLAKIKTDIDAIERNIANHSRNKNRLDAALIKAERDYAAVLKKSRATAKDIGTLNHNLTQSRQERNAAKQELAAVLQKMAASLRAAYIIGSQSELKMLLNQRNPADLSRLYTYLEYVNAAREQQLASGRALIGKLAAQEQKIQKLSQDLNTRQTQYQQQQQSLKTHIATRQKALKNLKQTLNQSGARLALLKKDQQNMQELVDKLAQVPALEDMPSDQSFAKLRGKLTPPIQGKIVQQFGKTLPHVEFSARGMVFSAKHRQKVRAVAAGRVNFAKYFSGRGMTVIIDHGGGFLSIYCYNDELTVTAGQWVAQGETIALAGQSGAQEEPQLYFELLHHKKPIDPRPWLGL